ncbi:hypothetical protein [Thiolapillus sp.]|uniref:hypothetical protein n=1 Tax=Thiolapillus sp. TaxID=2017437 RepID=UPI003AF7BF0F
MNVFSNTFTDIQDLRSVIITDDESQNAVAKGDVFFTVSSETPEEAGMSSVLLGDVDRCYLNSFCALFRQACLRPRDRFWDIPVPKIDSAFDNLFVPQPSWSPSTAQQLRKLVAAPYLAPI